MPIHSPIDHDYIVLRFGRRQKIYPNYQKCKKLVWYQGKRTQFRSHSSQQYEGWQLHGNFCLFVAVVAGFSFTLLFCYLDILFGKCVCDSRTIDRDISCNAMNVDRNAALISAGYIYKHSTLCILAVTDEIISFHKQICAQFFLLTIFYDISLVFFLTLFYL